MLKSMRGSGNSRVMWVVIGLLMVGLAGFGIGGLTGGTLRTIGSVGDEPIEITPYATGLRNAIRRMSMSRDRVLSPSEILESGIQAQVLDAIVGIAALNNEVSAKGLSVGDEAVRNALVSNPQFAGINGSFDREGYEFYLTHRLGISAAEYESLLRKEIARGILEAALIGGVDGTGIGARVLMNFAREERFAEWAELTAEALQEEIPASTDAQLEAYYKENIEQYRSPLTRQITYAWLDPAALTDKVNIPEEDVRGAYDDQFDRFNQPERRVVDRLVFPDTATAQEARTRLDTGEASFTRLISERGLAEADISLGAVERGSLAPAAADIVFTAESPGVVGPVESGLGPALFRINAVLAADSTSFEDALPELRDELAGEAARYLINELVEEIDDLLAAGATIEELGSETKMVVSTINYSVESTDPITGYEAFRTAAESAHKDDFPEIIDLADGGVLSLRLDGIVEPADIPLADIRDRVRSDWQTDQTVAALQKMARGFVAEIAAGTEPDELIWNVEETLTRTSFVDDLPPATVPEIFSLESEGDIAIIEDAGRVILARVTDIIPFDPEQEGAEATLLTIQARRDAGVAVDMLNLFSRALQNRSRVRLNHAAINRINNRIMGLDAGL
ncbi:MAG: SurA N-terminal domain-containing protein [Rhodobacteraceae bacterium]|nr:SurA N-terminal domain-containing protein [Paracoccaceae bacterium]